MSCEHSSDIDSNCNCYEEAMKAKKQMEQIEIQQFILAKRKETAKSIYENYFQVNKQQFPSTFTKCVISTLIGIFIGYKFKYKINTSFNNKTY